MRRIFLYATALLCMMSMLIPSASSAANANSEVVSPCYLYTSEVRAKLNISSTGTASCVGKIKGWASDSNIAMTVTLYKQTGNTWEKVTSWSDSATGVSSLSISESYDVAAGTYKVVVTGTVTDPDKGSEDLSQSSAEVVYE